MFCVFHVFRTSHVLHVLCVRLLLYETVVYVLKLKTLETTVSDLGRPPL